MPATIQRCQGRGNGQEETPQTGTFSWHFCIPAVDWVQTPTTVLWLACSSAASPSKKGMGLPLNLDRPVIYFDQENMMEEARCHNSDPGTPGPGMQAGPWVQGGPLPL